MLLKRLDEFHHRIKSELPPPYHKQHEIHWIIDITSTGKFKGFTETTGDDGSHLEEPIPYFRRSGANPPPYLVVDKPPYVLDVGLDKFSDEKANRRHKSYIEMIESCAESCPTPEVQAVLSFLNEHREKAIAQLPEGLDPDDWITFRVNGQLVHRLEEVGEFWKEHEISRAAEKSKLEAQCIVCGKVHPIADRHPVEIQIGRDRTQLVTANENAYESYGLEASAIAPICNPCSLKYGLALRYLFNSDKHSRSIANVNVAFWTKEPADFNFLQMLSEPDPDEVARLIESPWYSTESPSIKANDFYALVVTSNQSRLIIRDWLEVTVSRIQKSISKYFKLQKLVDNYGREGSPCGLYSLASSLVRDFRNLSPRVVPALLNCALKDNPLPRWLLHQAVKRAHADTDNRMTYPRAVLMKMVLNSKILTGKEEKMTPKLDPKNDNSAYLCGRLLSVLEEIQQAAVPSANTTIVDRFYGTASSAPASVFGNLMRKCQNHLGKLRNTKKGAYYALQSQLEEVYSGLSEFPKILNIEEQGLFAIGYYHQRAASRAEARKRAKEKEESEATTT